MWVKACAAYAIRQLGKDHFNEQSISQVEKILDAKVNGGYGMLSIVEKVIILKYVIVSGKVRVFDGEHVLNDLGEGDVFGEMALLDPEPRLARVNTPEETSFLQLEREPFFELLEDHSEVARGIIQVLSRRLRSRVQDLADLRARAGTNS